MKNSTAIILILISFGLFYTFINPQYKKVGALRQEANTYENILDSVSELTQKRDELLVKYQSLPKDQVEDLSKVLPNNIDTVRLARDFDTIAGKYGISLKQIRTTEDKQNNVTTIFQTTSKSPLNSTTVSFSFLTTYENFRKFMKDIEQSLRIIDIQSVSIQTNETGLYEFQVSIKTYWLK